jgi:hypothetical protein
VLETSRTIDVRADRKGPSAYGPGTRAGGYGRGDSTADSKEVPRVFTYKVVEVR